ncbi:uncharacterized protein LOC131234933 isoform X1 [Magnolia sinica]|uniref:uncharacterized protein LOC131234933 isoform X1 n=1 Tax=Magnolia sinica TaxID=86752 RepID=UPI002658E457|nr:uncharacterized protein LOC131234933 isoform X1 [Magnolia sinica]XP_058087918.1 uncharacterized protein LOC131234933 isoform X1 [Magnolia sinica]
MDDKKVRIHPDLNHDKRDGLPKAFYPALDFFSQIPQRLQSGLKTHFKQLMKNERKRERTRTSLSKEKVSYAASEVNLVKQLQVWKENPTWIDQPSEVKVSVPKGSLCNLNVKFQVGLPPDAVYNIVIDPENKRVFKNIKEVISRKVLVDEGLRQVVEVEQAAIWKFLWWSGTISVHVLVDQNREDHSVKFKQGKVGFMKRFEGCWKVEPLFVDDQLCHPFKPEKWANYDSCTGGKGRVGSVVSLQQLIQPALVPPPPISWYLRGITTRTTEMLINDLQAEAARIRGSVNDAHFNQEPRQHNGAIDKNEAHNVNDIKERWRRRRINKRKQNGYRRSLIQ